MLLREDFEKTGNILFRGRSFFPIIFIGLTELTMIFDDGFIQQVSRECFWEVFCLIVSLSGLFIRIITIGIIPKRTSGRNRKVQVADELNTKGIYSVVRNPLYLGNFFIGFGFALYPQIIWLMVLYILAFWLYYERIIYAEEAFLYRRFGEKYILWANKTPVFIPHLRLYQKPDLKFSFRNILRREYNGLFSIILVIVFFELANDYSHFGKIRHELGWYVLLGFGILFWMIIRVLSKHTSLLRVEGR